MANISVSDADALAAAIATEAGTTGADTITVLRSMGLTAALPALSTGAGGTLSLLGQQVFSGRFSLTYPTLTGAAGGIVVSSGSVAIGGLTVDRFQGAVDSITGAGSAFFVGTNASLTLGQVTMAGGGISQIYLSSGATLNLGGIAGDARITGAGHVVLTGGYVFNAASDFSGGITIDNTLAQIGVGGQIGTGAITFTGTTGGLSVAGTIMPTNALGRIVTGQSIALTGVSAQAAALLTIAPDHTISFATQGGGTATLHLDPAATAANSAWVAYNVNGHAVLAGNTLAAAGFASVRGNNGDVRLVMFDDAAQAAIAQSLLDPLNAGALTGNTVIIPPVFSVETLASGQAGLLLDDPYGWPGGPNFGLTQFRNYVNTSMGAVTVNGQPGNGQLVITGQEGMVFTADTGAGTVIAGGGNNSIGIPVGSGSQRVIAGNGNDTVLALGGDETIAAGGGSNAILLGQGTSIVDSRGTDLIVAGTGAATIATHGGSQVWLGGGTALVQSSGIDTIIGGAGAATVQGGTDMVFAGIGALAFTGGAGSSTLLGNAAGSLSVTGGSGTLLAVGYGATRFQGGSGAATVAAFGGSATIQAGAGGGVFLGGPGGHNILTGGSGNAVLFGGGDGDVLTAGSGSGDVLVAGTGAETLTGAGTGGAHSFYAGAGPNLIVVGSGQSMILTSTGAATLAAGTGLNLFAFANGNHPGVTIQGFNAGLDYIGLQGFASGEAATALAGATTAGGSESLTLSDGTHITLVGFTGLTSANFL